MFLLCCRVQVLVDQQGMEHHSNSLVLRALQPPRPSIPMLATLLQLQLLGMLGTQQLPHMVATPVIRPSNLPTLSPKLLTRLQLLDTPHMEHSQLPTLMLPLSRLPTVHSMVQQPPMHLQHIGRS